MRQLTTIAVALLGVIAACSDAPATSAPTSAPVSAASTTAETTTTVARSTTSVVGTAVATTVATTVAATTTTTADDASATWTKVDAPSDCMCADGSAYSYWIRKADPTKVVLFMQGGGACFSASTCAFDSNNYKVTVSELDDPNGFTSGIFDFADPRNPLADHSFVFVPYCTGDLHLGKVAQQYSPDLTIQHNGSVNASTALHDLAAQFPGATEVVVAGESAGSAPTPLYAGLAGDLLPDAEITVLADGSGAYPDMTGINALIGQLWGVQNALPAWPELSEVQPEDWSLPGLFVRAYEHDPDIIFGRHDYAYDGVQQFFAALAGIPADDLVALIDGNENQIEQSGVDLHNYLAPGESHTVLSKPAFYTETVEGVALVDWVTDLVRRRPDLDVHCTDCTAQS